MIISMTVVMVDLVYVAMNPIQTPSLFSCLFEDALTAAWHEVLNSHQRFTYLTLSSKNSMLICSIHKRDRNVSKVSQTEGETELEYERGKWCLQ